MFSFLPCQIAITTAKKGPKIPNTMARVTLRSSPPLCFLLFGGALLDAVGKEDVAVESEVVGGDDELAVEEEAEEEEEKAGIFVVVED